MKCSFASAAVAIVACAMLLRGQAPIETPEIGQLVADGAIRKIQGIPGAFLLGEAQQTGVVSLRCTAAFCVAKTENQIIAGNDSVDAPRGSAIFTVEGKAAYFYFSSTRQIGSLRDGKLALQDWGEAEEVVALRLGSAGLEVAVREGQELRVMRLDRSVIQVLTADGPVELFRDGVAYAHQNQVFLRHDSGQVVRFALDNVESFFRPASDYLGVRTSAGTFLIRWTAGREEIWQLPEAAE